MSQLMPLPLTVSCFSKIQIGFTFLVLAYLGSPGKRAVKRVCVFCCSAQSAMEEELELTTDGSDIFLSRKTEPFVICAISLTSAAIKTDGHCLLMLAMFMSLLPPVLWAAKVAFCICWHFHAWLDVNFVKT